MTPAMAPPAIRVPRDVPPPPEILRADTCSASRSGARRSNRLDGRLDMVVERERVREEDDALYSFTERFAPQT